MECSSASIFFDRVTCILSYDGNHGDIALNYSLFLFNLVSAIHLMHLRAQQKSPTYRSRFYKYSTGAILFVISFQMALCLFLGCTGISIVWAACAGWSITEMYFMVRESTVSIQNIHTIAFTATSLILTCLAIIYYAILAPPITTLAHVLAVLMGSILSLYHLHFQAHLPPRSNLQPQSLDENRSLNARLVSN